MVDVREPGEYGAGHILGAKNLPLARIESARGRRGEEARTRAADPVLRAAATAAGKAAAALTQAGLTRKVVNLSGGLGAWQQAGLPVEKLAAWRGC